MKLLKKHLKKIATVLLIVMSLIIMAALVGKWFLGLEISEAEIAMIGGPIIGFLIFLAGKKE